MTPASSPGFREALRVWVRVALSSFGGPAGQIAVMQRILVDEKGWVRQTRFLHALNYCMLLPGPEAQQLATYNGWLLHGWKGGLAAGGLFILPGFLSILVLSVLYAGYGDVAFVEGLFYGLKPAVLAIVVAALLRIGKRTLRNGALAAIAAAAFVGIFVFAVPFPMIIGAAALVGLVGGRISEEKFWILREEEEGPAYDPARAGSGDGATRPAWGRTWRTTALWLAIWWVPVVALITLLGTRHVLVTESIFFSKAAVVTFGGAYAVLAYIAQQAVETFGWLLPGEMLDGLGMAETTPGPLIQVVQFVGFMGAYRNPGGLDPMAAGVVGSVVTTWVTFAPCFLWIFVGAPYIEWLRGRKSLATALSAITAAVVGVILNLALWFAIHVTFGDTRLFTDLGMRLVLPVWSTVDPATFFIAILAFLALLRLRWGMLRTLAAAALAGISYHLLVA